MSFPLGCSPAPTRCSLYLCVAHFQDKFRALLEKSEASKKYANFMKLYRSIEEHVFSLEAKDLNLGFPDKVRFLFRHCFSPPIVCLLPYSV